MSSTQSLAYYYIAANVLKGKVIELVEPEFVSGAIGARAKAIIICCQCRIAIGGRLEVRKTDLAIGC